MADPSPSVLPTGAAAGDLPEAPAPPISVVVPVHNEADAAVPLAEEIAAVLIGRLTFEMIFVDDGSTDATADRLAAAAARLPALRIVRHRRCAGQSAAIATGVAAARAPLIVTLDGDGQNDPADIPSLVAAHRADPDSGRLMIAGRRARRRDSRLKRLSSRLANGVRSRLLGDDTADTGCGLKVFPRAAFLAMPHFDHMHRFLPALMLRQGGRVVSRPVNHRPRTAGVSKYGTLDRLMVGIFDLLGVLWLQRRARLANVEVIDAPPLGTAGAQL